MTGTSCRNLLVLAAAVTAVAAGILAGLNLLSPVQLPAPLNKDAIPAIFEPEPENPYEALYFYEADKQERYEAYRQPILIWCRRVVWRSFQVWSGILYQYCSSNRYDRFAFIGE